MNTKEEFLEQASSKNVKCAHIKYGEDYFPETQKNIILKVGYSQKEYSEFLNNLDFEYDDGFGGQELFGNIWYIDGTWSERDEYDGSKWWAYKKVPEITNKLL